MHSLSFCPSNAPSIDVLQTHKAAATPVIVCYLLCSRLVDLDWHKPCIAELLYVLVVCPDFPDIMGFFTDLLTDVEQKSQSTNQAHQLKRKLSTADEAPAWKAARHEVSQHYNVPFDIHPDHLICKAADFETTPLTYEHGPRHGAGLGPLISYLTHAAIVGSKLNVMLADKLRLEDEYEDAVAEREDAKQELGAHRNGQRRFLQARGEDGVKQWAEAAGVIRAYLREAERKIERVREEARVRRSWGFEEEAELV